MNRKWIKEASSYLQRQPLWHWWALGGRSSWDSAPATQTHRQERMETLPRVKRQKHNRTIKGARKPQRHAQLLKLFCWLWLYNLLKPTFKTTQSIKSYGPGSCIYLEYTNFSIQRLRSKKEREKFHWIASAMQPKPDVSGPPILPRRASKWLYCLTAHLPRMLHCLPPRLQAQTPFLWPSRPWRFHYTWLYWGHSLQKKKKHFLFWLATWYNRKPKS